MKKIMYFAAALLVLAGCRSSQEARENAPAEVGTITGTIKLPQGPNKIVAPAGWESATAAFTMKWESTDKIYIYNASGCKELTVQSIDESTGIATFEGELLEDMSNYNVAYRFNPTSAETAFAVDYINGNYHPFAWGDGDHSVFTIDKFGPVMGLKLKGNAKVDKIEVIVSKSDVAQATYTMTLETAIELNTTTFEKVYFPLNDLGDADKLEAKFYQGTGLCKTQAFVTLPAKNRVTTYPTIEGINYDPYNGHAYVDLGLPSGLKWATCNVGATNPEDHGDYFAWGETEPYYADTTANPITWKSGKESGYAWQSYCGQSSFTEWSPIPYDADKNLLLTKDAAAVNWGGAWRMPTEAEFTELKNNCNSVWTTYNGVNGYKFTSKTNSANSIFLPAAGSFSGSSPSYAGSSGYYWSSSLRPSYSDSGRNLSFNSVNVNVGNSNRYYGRSVRPVCQ